MVEDLDMIEFLKKQLIETTDETTKKIITEKIKNIEIKINENKEIIEENIIDNKKDEKKEDNNLIINSESVLENNDKKKKKHKNHKKEFFLYPTNQSKKKKEVIQNILKIIVFIKLRIKLSIVLFIH